MRTILVSMLILFSGCITGAKLSDLPAQEQARFNRCWNASISRLRCRSIYRTSCIVESAYVGAEYSSEPSENARKRWLIENGCPPSMVNPGRYM